MMGCKKPRRKAMACKKPRGKVVALLFTKF